jgi:methylated-DNA-[protein]-cysteine S-methyltransferase
MIYQKMKAPFGALTMVADEEALIAVLWPGEKVDPSAKRGKNEILSETERQLREYFEGRRKQFELPLRMDGTRFQKTVWAALRQIPYGETVSYGDLAREIGKPKAFRAVGTANGRNPLPIVVPCHRVIASSGGLAGFAGGLKTKLFLLELEGRLESRL